MKRTPSLVWEGSSTGTPYFTKITVDGKLRLACNLCERDEEGRYSQTFSYKNGSTSSALLHLTSIHGVSSKSKKPGILHNILDNYRAPVIDSSMPGWPRFIQKFCYWLVDNLMPLNILTKPSTRSLFEDMGVVNLPQPRLMMSYLVGYQSAVKESILIELASLQSSVALTADSWTSKRKEGYFTITCHYISLSWVRLLLADKHHLVHASCLSGVEVDDASDTTNRRCPSHSSILCSSDRKCNTKQWLSETSTVSAIVTDNEAAMRAGVRMAQRPSLACFVHTMQLCVKHGLNVPQVKALVTKAKQTGETISAQSASYGHTSREVGPIEYPKASSNLLVEDTLGESFNSSKTLD